jgi:hypothetical protein
LRNPEKVSLAGGIGALSVSKAALGLGLAGITSLRRSWPCVRTEVQDQQDR